MSDESVAINLSLDMDAGDLDRAIGSMTNRLEQQFGDAFSEIEKMIKGLNEAIKPMTEMANMAKRMSAEFEKVKKDTDAMRQNVASTRLQVGGTGQGTGFTGGGFGGTPGMGALAGLLGIGSTGLALGGIGLGAGLLGWAGSQLSQEFGGISNNPRLGLLASAWRGRGELQREIGVPWWSGGISGAVGVAGAVRGMYRNITGAEEVPNQQQPSQFNMRNALLAAGVMRGIGQGPMGMFANISGTTRGWEAGSAAGTSLFPGSDLARTVGGSLGALMLPGMIQNYAQEAMSRYPAFLQTSASIASVGMYGGNRRQIMGMRPGRFGYGPGEVGPEFSGLFQGYGGGDLTEGTQRTAMAYSRAYGVNMGAIGQSMGGLINVGGGGQSVSAAVREQITMRVMADAVAEGFGRRLPEYAQAVGSSMQNALSGPALVGQSVMPGLISVTSRLTGQVAGRQGLGLEAAGRLLQPLMGAPQNILEGMFSGRGDPYQMAMYWGHNRGRFGGDPMRMMEALERNAATPFSREALQFQRGPLQEILRASPNDAVAVQSLRQLMPNISFTGARQVVERGREAMERGGGSLEGVDMQELFTGVEETEVNEAEETRETMRDIQRSGEEIMNSQLRAMQDNARYAWAQHGISAEMSRDAATFHRVQMGMTRVGTQLMRDIGVSQDITALGNLFDPAFIEQLRTSGGGQANLIVRRLIDQLGRSGMDVEQLARSLGFPGSAEGRGVRPGDPGNDVFRLQIPESITEFDEPVETGPIVPGENIYRQLRRNRPRPPPRLRRHPQPEGTIYEQFKGEGGGTDFKAGHQRLARVVAGNK